MSVFTPAGPGDGQIPIILRGRSPAAARQLREVMQAAASADPALITGEPGLDPVGVAQLLHGRQAAAPFLVIDCADTPGPELHERLFGGPEPRGARVRDLEVVRNGCALTAVGTGTIALHQVHELPAALQRRLGRVLRDGEVYVGDARRGVPVRARFVASAHPDIDTDVAEARFRSDLFRRLGSNRIRLAPLRERPEDVAELAASLLKVHAAEQGQRPRPFTPAALTALASLPWPGNLDELSSVLRRLQAEGSAAPARQEDVLRQVGFGHSGAPVAPFDSLRKARQRFEREYIAAVLARHDWRMVEAAATLGIERANLYRKVRQLGLSRTPGKPGGEH